MRLLIIFLVIIGGFNINAQDTLYVYDTIYIYDTIKVYDTIRIEQNNEAQRFESHSVIYDSTYLINNDSSSVSSLKNDILIDETLKKIEAMKNINLFGVLFIAIQNITLKKHDLGIEFGISGFGTSDNVKEVSNPFTPGLKAGIFYIHNFNKKIGLEMGVNFLYNINNKKATTSSLDSNYINYTNQFNNDAEGKTYNFNLTKYHSQLAIPLLFNVRFNKFTTAIGFEYRYKTYRKTAVFDSFIADLGLKAALKLSLNEKLSINLSYYQGINREGQIYLYSKDSAIDTQLKSYSLSTSLAIKI